MLDWVLGLIGGLLYPLFSIIFVCIDGIQGIFFAFAGIGDISFGNADNNALGWWESLGSNDTISSGNSGAENDTGILYYLFHNSLVRNMLISIMLLALFLTIFFTVMAFIKNVYASKQKGWKEIIGNAIKGLANFIFLPVVCILGVWLGNILLQAINGATSGGGTTQMDRKLFIAAAYNANEFRNENPDLSDENIQKLIDWANGRRYINSNKTYDASTIEKGRTDAEYYANIVDHIYANTYTDIYSWWSVETWYSLHGINYLILIVGGIFMLYSLCSLAFAMVRRLFLLVILFIISPGVCALYPLDEGKAVQSWAGEVKKLVLSAYGAVAGINIFFSLIPLIDKIHIGTGAAAYASAALLSDLVQIFILVAGLLCVKEVVGLISGFVGGEDALSKGSSMMKSTTDALKKRVGGVTKKTVGAFARAKGQADATNTSMFGHLVRNTATDVLKSSNKALTGVDIDEIKKEAKDKRKEALEHPNSRLERRVERYNEDRSNAQFTAVVPSVNTAIATARAGSRALTNDEMAAVLSPIRDKEAKRRAAAMMANYNNQYNMNNGGSTTTIEKVLEAEDKVLQEESRRQDSYGASTDYTGAFTAANTHESSVSNFQTTNGSFHGAGLTFNRNTGEVTYTLGGGDLYVDDEILENLRLDAEADPTDTAKRDAYTNAVEGNRIVKQYKKIVEKEQANLKEVKSAALNFANGLEKLAENYSGATKASLMAQSNNVKSAVNATGSSITSINTAITSARTAILAIPRDGTELDNILNTGHR